MKDAPENPDEEWIKSDNAARALIGLHVDDSQVPHIRQKKTAKEVWESLKNFHGKTTLTTRTVLYRQMYETKMEESDNLEQHLNLQNELFQKLEDMGENLSEHLRIGSDLSSLPRSWHHLVTALEVRKDEELTLTFVESKLFDEQIRRRGDEKEEQVMRIICGQKKQRESHDPTNRISVVGVKKWRYNKCI